MLHVLYPIDIRLKGSAAPVPLYWWYAEEMLKSNIQRTKFCGECYKSYMYKE